MKRSLIPALRQAAAIGFVALAGTLGARAEEPQHPAKPLLWKIEGKGLEEPSYLFGTVHIGSGPVSNFHPAAAKAFDSADVVYTEIALDPGTQMALAADLIRKDGTKLSESIGPELAEKVNEELKRVNEALDITPFEALKTWAVGATLPMLEYQLRGEKALDMLIHERAAAAGKETGAIEEPRDQTGIFDALTEEEQVIMLSETIRQMREDREDGRNPMKDMIDAYIAGEPEGIEREMVKALQAMAESEHKELGERLMKQLLEDRDVKMAESIDKLVQAAPDRTHFFAAGAGHFAGETSIRSHLADKGYKVTAITE